ncbi:MAG: enoyl-CoA hydratase-related protein [Sulfuricaulis sp.]|nr:enoyl-CoA hydratase-related protein [Sulfuricaulis sp.]
MNMKLNDADAPVLVEKLGAHVVMVTINRPLVRNAINGDVTQALDRAWKQVEADPDARVAILSAAGDQVFCAGADLKEIAAGNREKLFTAEGGFAGFVHAKRSKVWIAAVNGIAVGGGTEIALACDMVVAAETASFGLPEVKRSLMALAGGIYRLARAIPRNIALEMIATGEPIDAARAYQLGLVSRVVPAHALRDTAIKLAETISANAPMAVRESVALARSAADLTEAELRAAGEAARLRLYATDDFLEGPRAFIERRAPNWSGR